MNTTETQIKALQDAITKAKEAYDIELAQNTQGHQNANIGLWKYPYPPYSQVGQQDFLNWLAASDASLKIKKANWENAINALDSFMKTLSVTTLNAAIATNPTLLVDIEKAKGQAEINKGKELFAQATTKYLIWGVIALVIIVAAIIVYKKKFAK